MSKHFFIFELYIFFSPRNCNERKINRTHTYVSPSRVYFRIPSPRYRFFFLPRRFCEISHPQTNEPATNPRTCLFFRVFFFFRSTVNEIIDLTVCVLLYTCTIFPSKSTASPRKRSSSWSFLVQNERLERLAKGHRGGARDGLPASFSARPKNKPSHTYYFFFLLLVLVSRSLLFGERKRVRTRALKPAVARTIRK